MEHFITAVTHLEDLNPGLSPLALVTSLRKIADNVTHDFVGSSDNRGDINYENNSFFTERINITHNLSNFLDKVTHHFITDDHEERGVVLTPDGTTVALAPLLLGLEYGLRANEATNQHHDFYLLPLAKNLGMSFLQFGNAIPPERLGPDGCWDSVSAPMVFTLSGVPSLATDALVHGGMDGAILGKHLSVANCSEVNLSTLLRSYYLGTMEELDHDLSTRLRGGSRRQNFKKITNSSLLQEKVADALHSHPQKGDVEVESLIEKGIIEFMLRYMGKWRYFQLVKYSSVQMLVLNQQSLCLPSFRVSCHHSKMYVGSSATPGSSRTSVSTSAISVYSPHSNSQQTLSKPSNVF